MNSRNALLTQPDPREDRGASGAEAEDLGSSVVGEILAAEVELEGRRDPIARLRIEIDRIARAEPLFAVVEVAAAIDELRFLLRRTSIPRELA